MSTEARTAVRPITEADFDEFIATAERPVLIDFWAEWCGPCRALSPVIEELATEWGEQVDVLSVDVDANPSLAARFAVQGIPTLVLLKDRELAQRLVGARPASQLRTEIAPHLA